MPSPSIPPPGVRLPLNLGLNDGTYAPQKCLDVLRRYTERTDLRSYSTADNAPLRRAIARSDQVAPENVFLHNGTGPILKLAIPYLLKRMVLGSPRRLLRHAFTRAGFPIITTRFTYSKVPRKAAEGGMHVDLLPLDPDDGFRFDVSKLARRLERGDGCVYLCSPNNPTGNVLITRAELEPLLERFPESRFWIDEAYVHYLDPREHDPITPLVARHPNLMVSRTFSFAYGLAALRVGYLLANPRFVSELERQLTDYRIGMLQEETVIAALEDTEHLPDVRRRTHLAREQLRAGLARLPGVEAFPSQVNFVLCRFTDGRPAADLKAELARRGILIKVFDPIQKNRFDAWFRITIGLPAENEFLLANLEEILGVASPRRRASLANC